MDELKVKVTGDNRVIYEVNPNLDSALYFFTQCFPPSAKKSYGIYETEICDYLNIKSTLKMFSEENGINLLIDDKLEELSNNIPNYFEEIKKDRITFSDIEHKLNNEKFDITSRPLKWFQKRNLESLCRLKCAADFSVPGAGKTAVALAFYKFHRKTKSSKLFVFGPLNSFGSWDNEVKVCIGKDERFNRATGDFASVKSALSVDGEFYITNFNSLYDEKKHAEIYSFLNQCDEVTIIVDESHQIKAPRRGELINSFASIANVKLILTGTPMPQEEEDLVTQFNFLYPAQNLQLQDNLIHKFQPLYTRTTKEELGLKPLKILKPKKIRPGPYLERFYQDFVRAPAKSGRSLADILHVESFQKACLRLIQLMSNPRKYDNYFELLDHDLAQGIKSEGFGEKHNKVIERVEELVKKGEKVLVWSCFRFCIGALESDLNSLNINNVVLQGGIPSNSTMNNQLNNEEDAVDLSDDDYEDARTREELIEKFKKDPKCMVMIANPAAAAESMSLQEICHHAIYMDRTFNAAHYIQSQDRIHRIIDKDKEKQKTIEIFQTDTPDSIDFRVEDLLNMKIKKLGKFLNDSSLENLTKFQDPDEIRLTQEDIIK